MLSADNGPHHRGAARRSHRKSRRGCSNCKKRHIKCDELRPQCSRCVNHAVKCDYTQAVGSHDEPTQASRSRHVHQQEAFRFVEVNYHGPPSSSSSRRSPVPQPSPVSHREPGSSDLSHFCPDDFELHHHFLSVTCLTLAEDAGSLHFWRDLVPRIGYKFPFILHLILALSGLHMAREISQLDSDHNLSGISRVDQHYLAGLSTLSFLLSDVKAEDSKAVWVGAIILSFISMARGPRDGEYLFFSSSTGIQGPEWISLLKGVQVLSSMNEPHIAGWKSSPQREDTAGLAQGLPRQNNQKIPAYQEPLQQLAHLISTKAAVDPLRGFYTRAIRYIFRVFDELRGDDAARAEAASGGRLAFVLYSWICELGDAVEALQQKKPIALVILAHFLVLMKQLDGVWFSHGWPAHVLRGIYETLGDEDRPWIDWPLREISKAVGINDDTGQRV